MSKIITLQIYYDSPYTRGGECYTHEKDGFVVIILKYYLIMIMKKDSATNAMMLTRVSVF